MAATEVNFSTKAPSRKAGRYSIDTTRSIPTGDMERVSVGSARNGQEDEHFIVFESGRAQQGIPTYAIALAVASGKVIPLDAQVKALVETGQLAQFEKAVEKARKAVGA